MDLCGYLIIFIVKILTNNEIVNCILGSRMKKCYKCGKKLKFWEGYIHPNLGRKFLVCGKCFDKIEKSVKIYRDFIIDEVKQNKINEPLNKTIN